MTFNLNRAFKQLAFVTGDYDGEKFQEGTFEQTWLLQLWCWFWRIFDTYDCLRYLILASLSARDRDGWEFYFGE